MSLPSPRVDIDDADPRIQYSAGWGTALSDNAYDRTLHSAARAGLTATLTFTGTAVGVTGCGGDAAEFGSPSMSVVIDGQNENIFLNDLSEVAPPNASLQYNLMLFASPTLAPGEHTIVLTNLNGTHPNMLVLDRFWYVASDTTSASQSSMQPSGTNTAPPTSYNSAPSKNTGAIVGGAVGGAAAVMLATVVACWLMKRRRGKRSPKQEIAAFMDPGMAQASSTHLLPWFTPVAAASSHVSAIDAARNNDSEGLVPSMQALGNNPPPLASYAPGPADLPEHAPLSTPPPAHPHLPANSSPNISTKPALVLLPSPRRSARTVMPPPPRDESHRLAPAISRIVRQLGDEYEAAIF